MTGEDLGYKAGVVENAKFEYSPLVKIFNKELKGKNENQLKAIEDQRERQLDMIDKQEKKYFEAI